MEVNKQLILRLRHDTCCGLYTAKLCLQQANSYEEAVKLAKESFRNRRLHNHYIIYD